MVGTILLVFAFVLAVIASLRWDPPPPWPTLLALALAFYFMSLILGGVGVR